MARILAKALVCEQGAGQLPDGTCPQCVAIARGEHPDVAELDAASRTGVDNVREEIINRVDFAPTMGRAKIYIIDEVHMLTTAAFNALLKTLEEPPAHVTFVLCTTDPQKIPATILSRVQRFDFHSISDPEIEEHLANICEREGFAFDTEALALITRHARGGMRDALSTLEQLSVFGAGSITLEAARDLLGQVDDVVLDGFVAALAAGDAGALMCEVAAQADAGSDLVLFAKALLGRLRDLYVMRLVAGEKIPADKIASLVGVREERVETLASQAAAFKSIDEISRALVVVQETLAGVKTSTNVRLALEICVVRLVEPGARALEAATAEKGGGVAAGVPGAGVAAGVAAGAGAFGARLAGVPGGAAAAAAAAVPAAPVAAAMPASAAAAPVAPAAAPRQAAKAGAFAPPASAAPAATAAAPAMSAQDQASAAAHAKAMRDKILAQRGGGAAAAATPAAAPAPAATPAPAPVPAQTPVTEVGPAWDAMKSALLQARPELAPVVELFSLESLDGDVATFAAGPEHSFARTLFEAREEVRTAFTQVAHSVSGVTKVALASAVAPAPGATFDIAPATAPAPTEEGQAPAAAREPAPSQEPAGTNYVEARMAAVVERAHEAAEHAEDPQPAATLQVEAVAPAPVPAPAAAPAPAPAPVPAPKPAAGFAAEFAPPASVAAKNNPFAPPASVAAAAPAEEPPHEEVPQDAYGDVAFDAPDEAATSPFVPVSESYAMSTSFSSRPEEEDPLAVKARASEAAPGAATSANATAGPTASAASAATDAAGEPRDGVDPATLNPAQKKTWDLMEGIFGEGLTILDVQSDSSVVVDQR
jgi:DNA polymerase-3 subunit gamma/tau